MKVIALSFTFKNLSDEEFEQLALEVQNQAVGGNPILLINGYMPRKVVEEKGYDTKLVDLLDKHFPLQLSMYDRSIQKTRRPEMAELAQQLKAKVVVIGEVKGGVEKDVRCYENRGCNIEYIEL